MRGRESKEWRFKLSQHAECSVNRKVGIEGEKRVGEMGLKRYDKEPGY